MKTSTVFFSFIIVSIMAGGSFAICTFGSDKKSHDGFTVNSAKNNITDDGGEGEKINQYSNGKSLLFGVFTFSNDTKLMRVLKDHYSNGNFNYVMQSIRSLPESTWMFSSFPYERKMIIVQSLDNITDAINYGRKYDVNLIVYDVEHWPKTPRSEQRHAVDSIDRGADIVHSAGFKYGITPDALYLLEDYKRIDWKDIDFVGMQLQRFSQNITEFSNHARSISNFIRSENPDTEIFVQVSFRITDSDSIVDAVESVRRWVDGVIVAYLPGTSSCIPNCTPEALDTLLSRIANL